jgi:hypothetical protein
MLLPLKRVLSLEGASPVQHPPAARLRRRLTEDHIGALGRYASWPAPAAAAPRQAGDEARTDGIGDAREHGADAAELAFHVNKIPISAAIEGRGAQDMVALVLRRTVGLIRASHPHTGGKRRWTC